MIAISAADQRSPRGSPLTARSDLEPGSRRLSAVRLSTWLWINPNSVLRELAVRFTDEEKYFVSEASVYRLLKAHDLITSPAYIVIKAAEAFKDKTTGAQPALAD